MAIIVSDAGPLIALAQTDHLSVLNKLFETVVIPQAVWFECRVKDGIDTQRIETAVSDEWLVVRESEPQQVFPLTLGAGEIAAMELALETKDALLILDDQLARREAKRRKLKFIGTAKVLLLAEQSGLIESAESVVGMMQSNGYRISPRFLR